MVHICVNSYEEMAALPRCIEAARKAAVHAIVVVVDGAYREFPHGDTPSSVDGSLEFARIAADVAVECPYPEGWPDEVVKRNAYFVGKPGDLYVVCDADEEIVGAVPEEFPEPFMDVMLHRDDDIRPYPVYRIHKHLETGIRYEGAHSAVWSNGTLTNSKKRPVYEGFHLMHHYAERKPERIIRKGRYYDWLAQNERAWRNSHVMV